MKIYNIFITIIILCLTQSCVALKSLDDKRYDLDFVEYETNSCIAYVMCYKGSAYASQNEAVILGISLKDGVLQSKKIVLPEKVESEGRYYSITDIGGWFEPLKEPKRTNTSASLELAVQTIHLPETLEKLDFSSFERFKNLKEFNIPSSLDLKSISLDNGDFNEECSLAYKENIIRQWKSFTSGTYISSFDNYSHNTYKWTLEEGTGSGIVDSESPNNQIPIDSKIGDDEQSISNIATNDNITKDNQSLLTSYSDVNTNIPTTSWKNENTFAVIIANEIYRREAKVEFALSDGEVFKQYCHQTLGLPLSNIHHVQNATLNDIRAEIQWIQKVAKAFNGEANFIFYYAGHGIPDESSRSAYLLPIDGYGTDVATGYKISDLYAALAKCPSEYTLVLFDACFSGSERNGKMLSSSRGVAIKAKTEIPSGNMIVFSATSDDETAYPYIEHGHGMFTYFLLKKLQESKGQVSFGDLGNYIIKNVSRRSIVDNLKSQTPTITPAPKMISKWKGMHFFSGN